MKLFNLGVPVKCPFCNKPIVFGLWRHIEICGKERQKQLNKEYKEKKCTR